MAIVDLKNLKTIKSEVIYTSTDSNGKSKATTPTMAGKKGPKPLMQLSQSNLNLKSSNNFNQPKTTKAQHSVNVFQDKVVALMQQVSHGGGHTNLASRISPQRYKSLTKGQAAVANQAKPTLSSVHQTSNVPMGSGRTPKSVNNRLQKSQNAPNLPFKKQNTVVVNDDKENAHAALLKMQSNAQISQKSTAMRKQETQRYAKKENQASVKFSSNVAMNSSNVLNERNENCQSQLKQPTQQYFIHHNQKASHDDANQHQHQIIRKAQNTAVSAANHKPLKTTKSQANLSILPITAAMNALNQQQKSS